MQFLASMNFDHFRFLTMGAHLSHFSQEAK